MPDLYRLDIMVNEEDFPLAQAFVAESAEMGWEEESLPTGDMLLRVTYESEQEREALAEELTAMLPAASLTREFIPDQDWMANWRNYFTPVEAGDFLILPPWMKDEDPRGVPPSLSSPSRLSVPGTIPQLPCALTPLRACTRLECSRPGRLSLIWVRVRAFLA